LEGLGHHLEGYHHGYPSLSTPVIPLSQVVVIHQVIADIPFRFPLVHIEAPSCHGLSPLTNEVQCLLRTGRCWMGFTVMY
ncbi:hypothetical protein, partial [Aeromonas jandaei]|uniref:hypothetical protein n=1 Tax=Aeromonas jandaei TaxID=650 RepID=UPI003670D509